jgi:hypothetical protein
MKKFIFTILLILLIGYILYLNQLIKISADAMQECKIGTSSALNKIIPEEKQGEIKATYNFVNQREKEFMKLKIF